MKILFPILALLALTLPSCNTSKGFGAVGRGVAQDTTALFSAAVHPFKKADAESLIEPLIDYSELPVVDNKGPYPAGK